MQYNITPNKLPFSPSLSLTLPFPPLWSSIIPSIILYNPSIITPPSLPHFGEDRVEWGGGGLESGVRERARVRWKGKRGEEEVRDGRKVESSRQGREGRGNERWKEGAQEKREGKGEEMSVRNGGVGEGQM